MLRQGISRNQMQIFCLESVVDQNSIVRVIDAFVDMLNLEDLGFIIKGQIDIGAPAYPPADLLKLLYYGYLHKVRTSRPLAREAKTNLEAMWLTKCLNPSYRTICSFRADNVKALQNAFYQLNAFLKKQDLFDQETVAIDGAKFRAQNSKKNNYNEKKVKQHLDYINEQTDQYLEAFDQVDLGEEDTEAELELKRDITSKLDHLKTRKDKYEDLKAKVEAARENGQTQVSTSDPDARALPKKMNIVEVAYNVLTAVEAKNKLITNFKVDNKNDQYQLSDLAIGAQKMVGQNEDKPLWVLADKGFDTGAELKTCDKNDIITLVAPRARPSNKKKPAFAKKKFYFDQDNYQYICPQGHPLKTNGTWYRKKNYNDYRKPFEFQRFICPIHTCRACPHKVDCVGKSNLDKSKGRQIERSQFDPYLENNERRYRINKERYRKRQEIVEHPFGTIKRQWGFDFTLLKTKEKVAAEFAIIFSCYNLRRAISIFGINELIKRMKSACLFLKTCLNVNLKPLKSRSFQKCKQLVEFFVNLKFVRLQLAAL